MEKKQIIKILESLVLILLMIGAFFAGFLYSNAKYAKEFQEKFQETLGEALNEEWNCLDHRFLDFEKIFEEYPNLNISTANKT